MGINVDDGFVYFNEMLYRVMRAQFVTAINLKFNKVMTVSELVTQFKIAEITLREKTNKSMKKADKEKAFFDQLETAPVNLFLTKMFFRSSFKAWRKYMQEQLVRQKWEKEVAKERKVAESLGKEYVEPEPFENKQILEEVEIEREELVELSGSSGEDMDDIDTKSRKSGNTYKMLSEFTKSNKLVESPEVFRMKARMRMTSNSKKFSMAVNEFD